MAFEEIEVKILEVDRETIISKILSIGGEKSFDGEMIAWFLDTPDGDFKQKGDVLRVRKEGDQAVLAYKKHVSRGEAKIMEETESLVGDPANTVRILELAGFEVVKKTRKFRTQYELGDAHIVLDDYQDELADIPLFIEIEAPSLERLNDIVHQLGYNMEACKNWSTRELVRHYLS